MHKYNKKKKMIMIGLCLVLLLMIVGYAAFSTSLNISSTAKVTSTWDVEITNIRSFDGIISTDDSYVGSYDVTEPTYTATSASFHVGLKLPGNIRMYEVEVTNKGNLTAQISIANLSCGNNDAISCGAGGSPVKLDDENYDSNKTNGFYDGQNYSDLKITLAPNEKRYIIVIVMYNDVTEQPENLNADISLELNYVQAD